MLWAHSIHDLSVSALSGHKTNAYAVRTLQAEKSLARSILSSANGARNLAEGMATVTGMDGEPSLISHAVIYPSRIDKHQRTKSLAIFSYFHHVIANK